MSVKTLQIDGKDGDRDRRAKPSSPWPGRHGIQIPRLCHVGGLSDVGACRLCLVEVEGQKQAAGRLPDARSRKAWSCAPIHRGCRRTAN